MQPFAEMKTLINSDNIVIAHAKCKHINGVYNCVSKDKVGLMKFDDCWGLPPLYPPGQLWDVNIVDDIGKIFLKDDESVILIQFHRVHKIVHKEDYDKAIQHGTINDPANTRYVEEHGADIKIICDRCGKHPLKVALGWKHIDLCLSCVPIVTRKSRSPLIPEIPTNDEYIARQADYWDFYKFPLDDNTCRCCNWLTKGSTNTAYIEYASSELVPEAQIRWDYMKNQQEGIIQIDDKLIINPV